MQPKTSKVARVSWDTQGWQIIWKSTKFSANNRQDQSPHYNVGKYTTLPLNLLTQNEYSLKNSFKAVERTKKILKQLLKNEDYTLILLYVV